jgi:CBS domain containing-hemolysin-like protein
MSLTGDIPEVDDVLQAPIGTFRIMKMQGNRVEEVEFSPSIDDATL